MNENSLKLKILVVDDNEDNASSLCTLLSLQGNEVRTAFDGASAIKLAEQFRPHLVLLDLGMPRMTGYAVCGAIRNMSYSWNVMIVAQTAWSSQADRRSTKDAGFDDHLQKPIDQELLTKVIEQAKVRAGIDDHRVTSSFGSS